MRFVWSVPLLVLALIVSATPSEAVIDRLGDAFSIAGSCDAAAGRYAQGEYNQAINTVSGEVTRAMREGGITGEYLAALGAAIAQLHRCMFQQQYTHLIVQAHISCARLKPSLDRVTGLIQLQGQVTGGVTQPFIEALLSNFQEAVKRCWAELASRCIKMDDSAAVQRAIDLIRMAEWVGLSRSDLAPPLRPCTQTIPSCRPNDPQDECIGYLANVAELLFGDGPPPAIGGGAE
jgi:hypothetical protein